MLQVVVFDIDGTLVDLVPAILSGLDAALAELRRLTPTAEVLTIGDLQTDYARIEAEMPDAPVNQLRQAGFARTAKRIGLDAPGVAERVAAVFFERRFARMGLFEETRRVLTTVRASYRVGVASNGTSTVARCGLAGEFAFELYAHLGGQLPKPHPSFFHRMVALAGVPPEYVVHVGDDLDNDVIAAQHAGLQAVWVNRARRPLPRGVRPEAVIDSLRWLPDVLDCLVTAPA